jgi:hypothetical protein
MGNRPSRKRRQEAPEDVGTLWTMERFAGSARCALIVWPDSWELRVIVDGTTLLSEHCARSEGAFSLAERWKERMLRDGWQQILPKETGRTALER